MGTSEGHRGQHRCRLPALDAVSDAEVERVWRMVGGHLRSLEARHHLLAVGDVDAGGEVTEEICSL